MFHSGKNTANYDIYIYMTPFDFLMPTDFTFV